MKKPASSNQTEKRAKRTPEEKTAHKSAKNAGRAATDLDKDQTTKKASQKKSLKSAAKQLQKELNSRMSEVVTRIRKETKAKLKEVVKEATRRLDGDTERMFEQALHTIVRHYDSVAGSPKSDNGSDAGKATAKPVLNGKKGQTLNKDGSPRKLRKARADEATTTAAEAAAPKTRGSKTNANAVKAQPAATGARRGPKPAAARAATSPTSGARRGPKPRVQAAPAPEATDLLSSVNGASTGEVSE